MIENANSHPFKVAIIKDGDEFYANSHPYQVKIVGGGAGTEAIVVDELPEVGEVGYIYLVKKEHTEQGDVYNEYLWALQQDGETYQYELIGSATINNNALTGHGAPTSATEADTLGQTYIDLDTEEMYYCSNRTGGYTWRKLDSEETHDDWGTLEYYTEVEVTFDGSGDNVEVREIDEDKLNSFLDNVVQEDGLDFMYEQDPETGEFIWRTFSRTGEILVKPEDMYETTGIDIVVIDPDRGFAFLYGRREKTVNVDGEVGILNLTTKEEYDSLGTTRENLGPISGVEIWKDQIKSYTFPNWYIGYTPEYFIHCCNNLLTIRSNYKLTEGVAAGCEIIPVTSFGDYFLSECRNFNSPIYLCYRKEFFDKYTNYGTSAWHPDFGNGFLLNCISWDSGLFYPNKCYARFSIGDNFLDGCKEYIEDKWPDYGGFEPCFYAIRDYVNSVGDAFLCSTKIGYYWFPNYEKVGNNFCSNTGVDRDVVEVNMPNCKEIGAGFLGSNQCTGQIIVNLENITEIPSAFLNNSECDKITFAKTPKFIHIGDYFIGGCRNLRYIDIADQNTNVLPTVLSVGNHFLYNDPNLEYDLQLPSVMTIGYYFLSGCTNAYTSMSFPNIQKIDAGFLYDSGMYTRENLTVNLGKISAENIGYPAFEASNTTYPLKIVAADVENILIKFPNNNRRNLVNGSTGEKGVTYEFEDTGDGWSVTGSDGSFFQHEDVGVSDYEQLVNKPITMTDANYEALWEQDNVLADEMNNLIYGEGA